ncbi:MAG TPA: ferritin [Phycisphaerae bacterium]|nr:ferritin [Phycisphaerae bacterium]
MLSKKMLAALNKQINAELYSSYLYLSMAAYFEGENLKGFAHWMRAQADEERAHGMKIYEHIHDRMGRVTLAAIAAPPATWASPVAAFKDTAKHEAKVTGMIHALADQAAAEKDHATAVFLQWFISEQVEEEATANDILSQLQALKDAPGPLLMLDRALGQRGKS